MSKPNFQPVLTGEQVELRPIRAEDFAEMFAAAADPLTWENHPIRDRYKEPIFREYFNDAIASGGALTILDKPTSRIIGMSRYGSHDPERCQVEIGWTFLARTYWGGAYNREVKQLMLDHAFSFVDTVVFRIAETNLRSRRAIEKIGAKWQGELLDVAMNGATVRHMVYEIGKPVLVT